MPGGMSHQDPARAHSGFVGGRHRWALAVVAASPALLMLADRAPWTWLGPFLGRFHALVLHFPIALLLLAVLLEGLQIIGRGRWRFPVPLVLFLGTFGAVAAMALGWLLRRADAIEGDLVERHMQSGMALAALAVATLAVRLLPAAESRPVVRGTFRVLLLATGVALLRTSHDGGSLTHGEDYLAEYAPWYEPVPIAFDFPTGQPVAQWDVYAHVVVPILQARCYECHSDRKVKGELVLDDWSGLERGGKSGPLLVAGRPEESLLLQRMELPPEHDEHMPPRRRPQATPEEQALLRKWIALGAPAEGRLAEIGLDNRLLTVAGNLPGLLGTRQAATLDKALKDIDPVAVAKLRAGTASAVEQLQEQFPHVLAYESRQSAELQLNATMTGRSFGDDELAALAPLLEHIVWADLSRTAVTDRSAPVLGSMKNLRLLRLGGTEVGDVTVQALGTLERLESLNLFGTRVSPAALPVLARMPTLQRLYLAQTGISANVTLPDALQGKIHLMTLVPADAAAR